MTVSRRDVGRAALLGLAGSTSGCLTKARTIFNRDDPKAITLSIKTFPSDTDRRATRIAQVLADNLESVGVETEVTPMSKEELFRDVLINHDFDMYVAQYPMMPEPDCLRALFHSRFNTETGWQNPVGFSDITVDQLLEAQKRQRGEQRRQTIHELQRQLVEKQPLTVIAFPDEIRGVRSTTFRGWNRYPLSSSLGYFSLESARDTETRPPLRVTVTDSRVTKNLNPLTVEFRSHGLFMNLLYDSLGRWVDGDIVPWLAASWTWDDGEAEITLREECRWHDGTALTASDVAFTYRFLTDTSLGKTDQPIEAPRFRGRASLVEDTTVVDETTLRLHFDESNEAVSRRALTIPVLPEHVWRTRTTEVTAIGVFDSKNVTDAIIVNNIPPVGSGPLRFDRTNTEESVVFSRNDDHFLHRTDAGSEGVDVVNRLEVAFDHLNVHVAPSTTAAVDLVVDGEADATATPGTAGVVPEIGRADEVSLNVHRSDSFYHVGYNNRRPPLRNLRFRRVIARLVDKASIVSDVFNGYATPAATPLAGTRWVPDDLRWEDEDPELPYFGSNFERDARRAFIEAGYRYEDETLVGGPS